MKAEYQPVADSEQASLTDEAQRRSWREKTEKYGLHLFITGLFLCVAAAVLLLSTITSHPSDAQCNAQTLAYSPLLPAIEYEELNFDNPFLHQTAYRGPPTNHLEREWERLWNHELIDIPASDFHRLNKSSEVRYMRTPRGGLAANIEVFHQLHCLNLIRQYTWREYYDAHPERVAKPTDLARDPSERGRREHVDHCIEALRLGLMCNADVTPYVFEQEEEEDPGRADFSAHHKCRRFDGIVAAFEERVARPRWYGWETKQYEHLPD